jgi:hypothetical protein
MLSLSKRAASAIVLLGVTQLSPASAEGNGPQNGTHLTANEVRSLGLAFSTAVAHGDVNESNDALGIYQVRLSQNSQGVRVSFSRADSSQSHIYSYHIRNVEGSPVSAQPGEKGSLSRGLVLSGLAAKAIVTVYADWLNGIVAMPQCFLDTLKSGGYTLTVWRSTNQRNNAPGFVASFVPLAQPPAQGLGCKAFRNYFVESGTWKVSVEPIIC